MDVLIRSPTNDPVFIPIFMMMLSVPVTRFCACSWVWPRLLHIPYSLTHAFLKPFYEYVMGFKTVINPCEAVRRPDAFLLGTFFVMSAFFLG